MFSTCFRVRYLDVHLTFFNSIINAAYWNRPYSILTKSKANFSSHKKKKKQHINVYQSQTVKSNNKKN